MYIPISLCILRPFTSDDTTGIDHCLYPTNSATPSLERLHSLFVRLSAKWEQDKLPRTNPLLEQKHPLK